MLSATELFVRRYDELLSGLNARDAYETVKLGAILRQLLLDGSPLIHQANREYNLKIKFTINNIGDISDVPIQPIIVFHSQGIDPSVITTSKGILDLKLESFLKQKIIETPNLSVTIREIIRFSANKYGGVHYDSVRSDEEKEIDEIFNQLRIIGVEPVANVLKTISKIVLAALKPLRNEIVKIPNSIPLFAHYKLEQEGAIHFAGEGQFLETNNLAYKLKEGFSWNCILKIVNQKNDNCYLYDVGNQNGDFPRFSLIFNSNSTLIAKAELANNLILKVQVTKFNESVLFERFCYISMQICFIENKVELELRVNNNLINSEEIECVTQQNIVNKQTIGADLFGNNSTTFDIRELVISEKCLDEKELGDLGHYFWMQWHD